MYAQAFRFISYGNATVMFFDDHRGRWKVKAKGCGVGRRSLCVGFIPCGLPSGNGVKKRNPLDISKRVPGVEPVISPDTIQT